MKRVGVREFKEHASALLHGEETFVVERHGTPIGYYVPIQHRNQAKKQEALDRLGESMNKFLAATGMTEDEFVEEMTKDWPGENHS